MRDEGRTEADECVKNARRRSVPYFCAVDAGCEFGDGGTRGGYERVCIVCARGGEDAVVAGGGGTHADDVEKPGAERREGPRLKIVVNESLSGLVAMLAEEGDEAVGAKMVQHSGGDINMAAEIGGKCVAVKEAARKRFLCREAIRFVDESGIQIHAG